MNDTSSVLRDREELIRDKEEFPVEFASAGPLNFFDKLSIVRGKGMPIGGPYADILKDLNAMDSIAPQMSQLLDEQIRRWLVDLSKNPKNAHLLTNVGSAYLSRGNIGEAIRYFELALGVDKDFLTARANLARVYMMQGNLDKALEIYINELRLRVRDTGLLMNVAHIYFRQGRWEPAAEVLEKILEIEPVNVAAHHNRGLIYLIQGKMGKALSEFRKSVFLDVRFSAGQNAMGVCYALMGNYGKAIKSLLASKVSGTYTTSTVRNLATVYSLSGDHKAASKVLEEYLERYPRDWEARNMAAFLCLSREEYERCLSHLEYLLTNANNLSLDRNKQGTILNNIGVAYQRKGLIPEAEKMYRESITTSEKPNPTTYFNLARLYMRQQDLKKAKRLIDEYLSIAPNDYEGKILLSLYYFNEEDYNTAKDILNKLVEARPDSRDAYVLLGVIYAECLEEPNSAIDILKKVVALDPQNEAFLNNLAYAYLRAGAIEGAKNTLDQIKWDKAGFATYATKGLLRICEGKVEEGSNLYDFAAKLAPNQEWKGLVRQKKRIEIARYLNAHGNRSRAIEHLKAVKSITTTSKLYVKQAQSLLMLIESSSPQKV